MRSHHLRSRLTNLLQPCCAEFTCNSISLQCSSGEQPWAKLWRITKHRDGSRSVLPIICASSSPAWKRHHLPAPDFQRPLHPWCQQSLGRSLHQLERLGFKVGTMDEAAFEKPQPGLSQGWHLFRRCRRVAQLGPSFPGQRADFTTTMPY